MRNRTKKNYGTKWTYDLTDKYLDNLEMLKLTFPEAYEFLKYIKGLEQKNFHMGTAVNMHFYFENHFIFYFIIIQDIQAMRINFHQNTIYF